MFDSCSTLGAFFLPRGTEVYSFCPTSIACPLLTSWSLGLALMWRSARGLIPLYIVLSQGGNQTTVEVTSEIGAFCAKWNMLLERIRFWTSPEKLSACHHLSVTRVFRDLLIEITTTICQAWDLTPQFACGGGRRRGRGREGPFPSLSASCSSGG